MTASYHDSMVPMMQATAHIVGFVLSIFTNNVSYNGAHCIMQGFAVEIIDECTGLLEMVIFLAAVLSFGTTIRKKALGLLMGIPAIYLFNVLRIIVLVLVGAYWPGAFDFMHTYFWQVTLILMIGSVWVGWLYLVVYREKNPVAVSS
jgi:archaeosortase B (VPXXXP-CTERM-specific)